MKVIVVQLVKKCSVFYILYRSDTSPSNTGFNIILPFTVDLVLH